MNRENIKKFSFICAGVALFVVVLTVTIVLVTGGSEEEEPPAEPSRIIPDGMRLVDDIYDGEKIIPDFDIPEMKYDHEGFSTGEDGVTRYKNAAVGIDVSEFQGEIDWYAVKASGIDFAFIRAGYRGMTQGLLTEDSRFQENMKNAGSAGVKRGVYFFSQAVTESEAAAEAGFIIEKLQGEKLEYPVVFDWEPPVPSEELPENSLRAHGCTGDTVTKCAAAFCKRVKEAGYIPCVYFNKNQAYNFYDLEELRDYDFWYAEYNPLPSMAYNFRIWQYTDGGSVPGIETTVDLDICMEPY